MKKLLKKIMVLICVFVLLTGALGACGVKHDNGEAVSLVIYRARSNGMAVGTDDAKVEKALEDGFYKSSGKKIDLKMQMYENDELPNKVDTALPARKVEIDAVMHTISADDSGSAIMKYAKATDDSVQSLDTLLETYGKNILKYIRLNDVNHSVEKSSYVQINDGMEMKIIPAVFNTKSFAIMVRKDYWAKAFKEKNTDLNPDDYDTTIEGYKNLTIDEFESVMKAIKKTINNVTYPVSGKFWDLSRTVGSTFGADHFNFGTDSDGAIIPQFCTSAYAQFADLLYDWSKNGVWEVDSAQVNDDTRKSNFIAGMNAAYMSYPTPSELISVSRSLSSVNSNAQCMIIAPLATIENGNKVVRGYYAQPAAFEGIVIPTKSQDAQILVEFIDWVYSSKDNYELAKHGIKGEHWIDGGQITVDGKQYETWAYPVGKEDQFAAKPPYSGCWDILININISNRLRADYNTVEKNWYLNITQNFPCYNNQKSLGVNLGQAPRTHYAATAQISADFTAIIGKAITGNLYNGKQPGQALTELNTKVRTDYASYIEWLNDAYTKADTFFTEKFKA